jgi:WD40 repeat protein
MRAPLPGPSLKILFLAAFSALFAPSAIFGQTAAVPEAAPRRLLSDGWAENHLYKLLVSEQVSVKNFTDLEKTAERFRRGERLAGGSWILPLFYDGLVGEKDGSEEARRVLLEEWRKEFPESQTAVVALAEWWTNYAWDARGGGWAPTVTEEGWEKFAERLDVARRTLYSVDGKDVRCPEWYAALLTVALGEGWPHEAYDKVFNEAVQRWPDYYSFYFRKAHYLLPRWYGGQGEWEAFAGKAADSHPEGDALYARIVWSKMAFGNMFEQSSADWGRMKRGLEKILEKYPASGWDLSQACKMAFQAGDYAAMAKWSAGLQGITVPNSEVTPGMLAYGKQMAESPSSWQPKEVARWVPDGTEARGVLFLNDHTLAVGTRDGNVYLCDLSQRGEPRKILSLKGPVAKFALSPDGRLLAIAQGSLSNSQKRAGSALVYDWQAEKIVAPVNGWKGTVTDAAFSPDGKKLFFVGGVATELAEWKVWDRESGEVRSLDWAKDRGNALVSVATHPSKPFVAFDWGTGARAWNYESGEQVFASDSAIKPGNLYYAGQSYIGQVWSVRFSPDGEYLVAAACPSMVENGSDLGGLTFWKMPDFVPLPEVPDDHITGADRLRFSPDGRFMISNDQGGMLVLRDAETRKVVTIFPARQRFTLDLAFSPNSRLIAAAGRDGSIAVWDCQKP